MEIALAFLVLLFLLGWFYLYSKIAELRGIIERDAHYMEWHFRSLENRKEDKPYIDAETGYDDDN